MGLLLTITAAVLLLLHSISLAFFLDNFPLLHINTIVCGAALVYLIGSLVSLHFLDNLRPASLDQWLYIYLALSMASRFALSKWLAGATTTNNQAADCQYASDCFEATTTVSESLQSLLVYIEHLLVCEFVATVTGQMFQTTLLNKQSFISWKVWVNLGTPFGVLVVLTSCWRVMGTLHHAIGEKEEKDDEEFGSYMGLLEKVLVVGVVVFGIVLVRLVHFVKELNLFLRAECILDQQQAIHKQDKGVKDIV